MGKMETTRRSITLPKKLLARLKEDDQKSGLDLTLSAHIQVLIEQYLNRPKDGKK